MRIFFLERSLGRGGAQRQLIALANGLADRGHVVTLALFYNQGEFIEDLNVEKVSLRFLAKKSRWDFFGFFRSMRCLLREIEPDLICTFLPVPNFFAGFFKWLNPNVKLVCGIRASNMNRDQYDLLSRLSYRLEIPAMQQADFVISNSKAGKLIAVANRVPEDKILVVPNGIDTERFSFDPQGRKRLLSEWNIKEDDLLVGIVGRLDPMKGHATFLRAAAAVAEQDPDVFFACVGDEGPIPRSDLVAMANSLGLENRVIWSDGRSDVAAVYSACDLIVSSSAHGEGFSNTIAEAMACGRYCIVTDVGDARLIVGSTGHICPPADSTSLALSVMQGVRVVRGKGSFNREARDRIEQQFSLEKMVSAFELVFVELAVQESKSVVIEL